jgi:hypothetical protein
MGGYFIEGGIAAGQWTDCWSSSLRTTGSGERGQASSLVKHKLRTLVQPSFRRKKARENYAVGIASV